ncbi:MAG: nitroreductase family protein, partial [Ilumatobacter sp.]|nr:nitroreductase family protein [Ilumatobacter sp.]
MADSGPRGRPEVVENIGLLEALATTRAIRRYTDDPVGDADLEQILWHAGRAPS